MTTALRITNLRKTYGTVVALDKVSLMVEANSFLALLGRNGAGKTTFIGILNSLIKKTSGKVLVYNKDIDQELAKIKPMLGIVPQELNLSIFEKPIQILINQAGYFGISRKVAVERAYQYLSMLDLWHKHNVPTVALSGGMKRRLMLAKALMHDPSILFLDEPTTGVDVEIRYKIWEFLVDLHKKGKTIVLTTHYLEEAEKLCDSLAIIDKGKILLKDKMSKILSGVKNYTIVLDMAENSSVPKEAIVRLYKNARFVGDHTIEIAINHNKKPLNSVLQPLMDLGVVIKNISNKKNSLEHFFNNLIKQ